MNWKGFLWGMIKERDCYACQNDWREVLDPGNLRHYGRKEMLKEAEALYPAGQTYFPFLTTVPQLPKEDPMPWAPAAVDGKQEHLIFPITWRHLTEVVEVRSSGRYGSGDLGRRRTYGYDQKTKLPTNAVYVCVTPKGRLNALKEYDRVFVGTIGGWKWGHRHFKLIYSDWIEDWKEVLRTLRHPHTKYEVKAVVVASELGKPVPPS